MRCNKLQVLTILITAIFLAACQSEDGNGNSRPNILLLMSDNHSWNHLGCYGDEAVRSPEIDRLAQQGIRFTNAFCSAPSCTPARAAMLTGQDIWRLEEGANLWGTLPSHFQVYTNMLEKAGYLVGHQGKGWGPGNYKAGGWRRNPAGDHYESFESFYNKRTPGQPFSFWFSSKNPHRPYSASSDDIDLPSIEVPAYLPDNEIVRGDIADYLAEVQAFDREVGVLVDFLRQKGDLENTLIIVCSDNGWQMPRGLANLYDFGTRIPMIIHMPERFKGSRVVDDFVNLNDLAPTFLELAGLPVPDEMTARSLVNILESEKRGMVEEEREFVVTGRERHAFVREGGAGYGGRAIRTKDFLFIRNYSPDGWPAGDPPLYGDVDAHMLHYPSPTKVFILKNRNKPGVRRFFDLAFAKRPAEELYDLRTDPFQMNNIAGHPDYRQVKEEIERKLYDYLRRTGDPRVTGEEMKWENAEYFAEKDKRPVPSPALRKELGLEDEYSYID